MNENYHIMTIDTKMYPAIVFSLSYESPITKIRNIERDLKGIGVKGKVIFDLLLCNGDNPDRYFEAYFNGFEINMKSFKQLKQIDAKILNESKHFYKERPTLLDNTIISKAKRYLLRHKT